MLSGRLIGRERRFLYLTFVTKSKQKFFRAANSTTHPAFIFLVVFPVITRSGRDRLIRPASGRPNQWHARRCDFALPEMEITWILHAPGEFIEHAALMRRPAAAGRNLTNQRGKNLHIINYFYITSLQLPESIPT